MADLRCSARAQGPANAVRRCLTKSTTLCVGSGAKTKVETFNVFSPNAFAGIGRQLPGTVQDRSRSSFAGARGRRPWKSFVYASLRLNVKNSTTGSKTFGNHFWRSPTLLRVRGQHTDAARWSRYRVAATRKMQRTDLSASRFCEISSELSAQRPLSRGRATPARYV